MQIDLIALDLDGTLLDPSERVSPRNRAVVKRALEAGLRVVLVTGRGLELPISVARDLGLNLPIICAHGALIKDFGANRTLAHLKLPLAAARELVTFAESQALPIAIYADESFWRLESAPRYKEHMLGSSWREVRCWSEILEQPPTFIRFLGQDGVESMLRRFGDLPLAFRHETWSDFTECAVLSRDASKRNALARLCADFQISPEHVLAIGDSRNDVPMLRWAGIGVAMGNALPEVKQAVHYVTASNSDDGVALAIERFVLGRTTSGERQKRRNGEQQFGRVGKKKPA